jgi:hypothetical protein
MDPGSIDPASPHELLSLKGSEVLKAYKREEPAPFIVDPGTRLEVRALAPLLVDPATGAVIDGQQLRTVLHATQTSFHSEPLRIWIHPKDTYQSVFDRLLTITGISLSSIPETCRRLFFLNPGTKGCMSFETTTNVMKTLMKFDSIEYVSLVLMHPEKK